MRLLAILVLAIGVVAATTDNYDFSYTDDDHDMIFNYSDDVQPTDVQEPTVGSDDITTSAHDGNTVLYNNLATLDPDVSKTEEAEISDTHNKISTEVPSDSTIESEITTESDTGTPQVESETTEEETGESEGLATKMKGVWDNVSDKIEEIADDISEHEVFKWAAHVHNKSSDAFLEGFNDVKDMGVFNKNANYSEIAKGSLSDLVSGLKCTGFGMVSFWFIPFVYIPVISCFLVWVIITLCFKCCCKSKEPKEDEDEDDSPSTSLSADPENPETPEEEEEENDNEEENPDQNNDDEPGDENGGDENDAFNPEDPLNSDEQQTADFAAKAIDAELTLSEKITNQVKSCGKWFWITLAAIWIISGISIGCEMCPLEICKSEM